MKIYTSPLLVASLLLIGLSGALPARSSTVHRYVEDFTTEQFKDAVNTTGSWNTVAGEIGLFPFEASVAGAYDTPWYARDVEVSGDYAYVSDVSSGLQVIDVRDPSNPLLVGNLAMANFASHIWVEGDYAYIADGSNGFRIVDITDPTMPTSVSLYGTPSYARGVTVDGDYAFVGDAGFGLLIFDIRNITTPTLIAQYPLGDFAVAVDIEGDIAFVATGPSGLHIFDVTDPVHPTLIGHHATPHYNREVVVEGRYAYLAVATFGLQVLDVLDPTDPVLVGNYNTPDYSLGVDVEGRHVYVTDDDAGLIVLDVGDPANPTFVSAIDTPGKSNKVTVVGDHAYVADGPGGLQVIRISEPLSPLPAGTSTTPLDAVGVAVLGGHALVVDAGFGLRSINVADPKNPIDAVGAPAAVAGANNIEVDGRLVYVAGGSQRELLAFDLPDPAAPALLSSVVTPDTAVAVAVRGNHAFLANGSAGLSVIDVSDSSSMSLAGGLAGFNFAGALSVVGNQAFVPDRGVGLAVVDITDPVVPALAGGTMDGYGGSDIVLSGNYAYVTGGGLRVYDIGDAANPVLSTTYAASGLKALAVAGDHAVAVGPNGLIVLDVTDPVNPVATATADVVNGNDVTVSGDFAYVADGIAGMRILQVFQRVVDPIRDRVQSMNVHGGAGAIIRAKLTSTQSDSVSWEVTADGGINWQDINRGRWNAIDQVGDDLRWRSTHLYSAILESPSCESLEVQWLYEFAAIDSIVDVPDDQGGWVRLHFTRSGHDFVDAGAAQIVSYDIHRRNDGARRAAGGAAPAAWEVVGSVVANEQDQYVATVETAGDSGAAIPYSVYYVSARTATPSLFFDSPPDSGYSVDNSLAVFIAAFDVSYDRRGVRLEWRLAHADDLRGFNIYRAADGDLNLIRVNERLLPADLRGAYVDDDVERGRSYRYRLGVVDRDGEFFSTVERVGVPAGVFALSQNNPNPFNPSTKIDYELSDKGAISLQVFDVSGRLIKTLVDGEETAGPHTVSWDGRDGNGLRVSSGVYFYRLQGNGLERTRKMVLIE